MTKSIRADVHEATEEQNYRGVVLSHLLLESCMYVQKKYTFHNDRCVDLELDRSMRRDYIAV